MIVLPTLGRVVAESLFVALSWAVSTVPSTASSIAGLVLTAPFLNN
jgi:hypothetical protein